MASICRGLAGLGAQSLAVDIECQLSHNLPTIVIVGFASRTVNEAKDRLRGAFASSGLSLPRRRITLNLAPADVPKSDSGLDAPMAVAVLSASQQIMELAKYQAVIGELGLDGSLRPVRGLIGKLLAGRQAGISEFFIPLSSLTQAQLVPHVRLYPATSLRQLHGHLSGQRLITAVPTGAGQFDAATATDSVQISDIVGQARAKRAALIAAAGGHNLLLSGPPGTGKTMLAKALPSLLPPLCREEALEITQLHSLVSRQYDQLVSRRPLRSPHHSSSLRTLLGGGNGLLPGEISLSHRGVLLLDELPEFSRAAIEALRQPLEDGHIQVSRTADSTVFPARFMLVATANPCPCGFYGIAGKQCSCPMVSRRHYQAKLSGPIMDRIDLVCDVYEVEHDRLLEPGDEDSADWPRRVVRARRQQLARHGGPLLNSALTNRQLRRYAQLEPAARTILEQSAIRLELSARAYFRIIKVARSIADLEASATIKAAHVSEAIQYRPSLGTMV